MGNSDPVGKKIIDSMEIDYDHINVAAIMDKIRKAAAEAPPSEPRGETVPPPSTIPPSPQKAVPAEPVSREMEPPQPPAMPSGPEIPQAPAPYEPEIGAEQPLGLKQKIKRIFFKLLRPFFPFMRLLALPVHEELRATVKSLHETNKRLDYLNRLLHFHEEKFEYRLQVLEQGFELRQQMLEQRFDERQDVLERKIDERMEELARGFDQKMGIADQRAERGELRLDRVEGILDERLRDLDKSMDYIKLLHNLDHNLVVELTKLKVEAEMLKSKFRILEKDQEFLQKREKALEERSLK